MQHLNVLTSDELTAVRKFQEYGGTIMVGYGNKATWSDLVHTNAYSTEGITQKLAELRSKANKQQEAIDDGDAEAPAVEFYAYDRSQTRINFTTNEAVLVLRAAKKARKYFEDAAEIAQLDAELAKIDLKTMSKDERLNLQRQALLEKRAKLTGQPVQAAPQPEIVAAPPAEAGTTA